MEKVYIMDEISFYNIDFNLFSRYFSYTKDF